MKKIFLVSVLLSIAICVISSVLFAAETNVPLTASQWIKYTGSGTITNEYDTSLAKDVLKIIPALNSSITAKYPASGSISITQIRAIMQIKTTKTFSLKIYALCSDNKYRWVYYEPGVVSITKSGSVAKVKVGEGLTNGQWQTIKTNVDADLFSMFGVHVQSIKQIRLSGELSLGELKFQDPNETITFYIWSPEQNSTITNMYVRVYAYISNGLTADNAKLMINGKIYPIQGGGTKYLLVPLVQGTNVLNITVEDNNPNMYMYGYGSLVVNCDPDSQDITFLAPNNWSFTSGQGTIETSSNNSLMGATSTFISNYEASVTSSNNNNVVLSSPTLNIVKEGLALKIKSKDYFYMYALVKGLDGLNHYIYYQLLDGNTTVSNGKVYCKIGKKYQDGEWHTIVRDIDDDLFKAKGVHLDSVTKVYFYGKKFSFGNVRLLKRYMVPEEYSGIQDAIDMANGGGLVKIGAGVYQGGILMKSGIILMGTNGHNITPLDETDDTIIDGVDYVDDPWNKWGILNPENNNFEDTVENQILYGLVVQKAGGGTTAVRCGFNSDRISIINCLGRENYISIGAGSYADVNIEFCRFENNNSGYSAISSWGGNTPSYFNVIGCIFKDNYSQFICFFYGIYVQYRDCIFQNNTSSVGNGGIIGGNYIDGHFKNCLFIDNISPSAVISLGVSDWNWSPDIENCTFKNNTGGAINILESQWGADKWIIKDNVIVNNGGPGISITYYNDGTLPVLGQNIVISNNDVMSNNTNYAGSITDQTGLNGNISVDPKFVAGAKGNHYLSQTTSGQAVNSPCVDKGSQTADAAGLSIYTTKTNNGADTGVVDIGYHYSI